jgi:hypothetical protein
MVLEQVPENYLLRLIEKHISFAFVRERLQGSYSENGRLSIDPELLLSRQIFSRRLSPLRLSVKNMRNRATAFENCLLNKIKWQRPHSMNPFCQIEHLMSAQGSTRLTGSFLFGLP